MNSNIRFLTGEGKIRCIEDGKVQLMHRETIQINGKDIVIYFKNVGIGEDTNTILVEDELEIGNLTPDRVKELLQVFLREEAIDLTSMTVVCEMDDIVAGEEYLHIDTWGWTRNIVDLQD